MSIKLNICLLHWYFQQNYCLSIKKHAVYNIHILAWGPICLWGPRVTAQHAHALRRHLCELFIYIHTPTSSHVL